MVTGRLLTNFAVKSLARSENNQNVEAIKAASGTASLAKPIPARIALARESSGGTVALTTWAEALVGC